MTTNDVCCPAMRRQMEHRCAQHEDPQDCPDALVVRWRDGRFLMPIHDGGDSGVQIEYCPWCGAELSRFAS